MDLYAEDWQRKFKLTKETMRTMVYVGIRERECLSISDQIKRDGGWESGGWGRDAICLQRLSGRPSSNLIDRKPLLFQHQLFMSVPSNLLRSLTLEVSFVPFVCLF